MRDNKLEGQPTPSSGDKDAVEAQKPATAEKKSPPAARPATAGQKSS
jgi:hypothetical protein